MLMYSLRDRLVMRLRDPRTSVYAAAIVGAATVGAAIALYGGR